MHLIRNSFSCARRQHRDGIVRALNPVYTVPSGQAAKDRVGEFNTEWGQWYLAVVQLWESSWCSFVPFLDYEVQIRRVICPSNAFESFNVRQHRAVRPGVTSPTRPPH